MHTINAKLKLKLTNRQIAMIKVALHAAFILPLLWLILAVVNGHLGADPVQEVLHFTGKSTLHSLFITLAVTPFARWLKFNQIYRFRRLLGLYSFFWGCLHLLSYIWFELGWQLTLVLSEILTRPYLVVGATTWLILFALSITSPKKIQSMLGKKWQALHNWVYIAVILGAIHYYWSTKSEVVEPSIYIAIAFLLLIARKDKIRRIFSK